MALNTSQLTAQQWQQLLASLQGQQFDVQTGGYDDPRNPGGQGQYITLPDGRQVPISHSGSYRGATEGQSEGWDNPNAYQADGGYGSYYGENGALGSMSQALQVDPATGKLAVQGDPQFKTGDYSGAFIQPEFINGVAVMAPAIAGVAGAGAAGEGAALTDAGSGYGAVQDAMYGSAGASGAAGLSSGTTAGAAGAAGSGLFGIDGLTGSGLLAGAGLASSLLNKPQVPGTPDYTGLANQQFAQQQQLLDQQTRANRFNQVTPNGSLNWSQDAQGNWTQTQTLSPAQQQILDQQNSLSLGLGDAQKSMLGQVNSTYSQPFTGGDPAARQQTIDSQYGAMTSRLDPQWNQREQSLQTRLANQGLPVGSEASNNATRDFNFGRNDAYQQAQNSALQMGNTEFQNSFNRNLQSYQLPMNMFNSLRSGTQLQQPNYQGQNTSAGIAQPANLTGAAQQQYGANLNQTNANNAYNANLTSGLFGLAGAYAQPYRY